MIDIIIINVLMIDIIVLYFACILTSRILSHPHFQPDSHQMYWEDSAEATCT